MNQMVIQCASDIIKCIRDLKLAESKPNLYRIWVEVSDISRKLPARWLNLYFSPGGNDMAFGTGYEVNKWFVDSKLAPGGTSYT